MELTWDKATELEIEAGSFRDFAKVPLAMTEGKHEVSGSAVKLFIIFYSFSRGWRGSRPKKIKGDISQSTFARKLEVTSRTIRTLTTELYNKGWIDIKFTGRSNKITLYGSPVRLMNE